MPSDDNRLPALAQDEVEGAGRDLWDTVIRTRGAAARTQDGALTGPFNAWLRSPILGNQLVELGTTLRFESPIDRRLLELAVVTVAAHWKAEFEWWAHSRAALDHGISQTTLDAIRDGRAPQFTSDDEQIVYDLVRGLLNGSPLGAELYEGARTLLGEAALVDLVALCGYYGLVSFTLNAFDVPLPAGTPRAWA